MASFLDELNAEGRRNAAKRAAEGVDPNNILDNLAWSFGVRQPTLPAPTGGANRGRPLTIADMYREVLPTGGALTRASPGVRNADGASVSYVAQPEGTFVANKDQTRLTPNLFDYGTNGVTGGNPAVAAIDGLSSRNPFAGGTYKGSFRPTAYAPTQRAPANTSLTSNPGDYGTGLFGAKMSPGMAATLVGGQAPLSAPATLPAPVAPKGLLQTIASMFAPSASTAAPKSALVQQAQAAMTPPGGFQPVNHAGERNDVFGNDMAFQPRSVQTSTRWNTGY